MTCGKGTYVRSLARDLAEKLGTKGYVSALRRVKVGPFVADNAISLANLEEMGINAHQVLLPLEAALDDIPALALKKDEAARLRNGNEIALISRPDFERLAKAGIESGDEAIATLNGNAIALIERDGPKIKPFRVFNI